MATFNPAPSAAYPLVAAQPGIWIADSIAQQRNQFTVAHYSVLHGDINRAALDSAIQQAMAEADTVQARFGLDDNGNPAQWFGAQAPVAPEWHDFSQRADASSQAHKLMQADLAAELPADGDKPLYRHALMRIGDGSWLWYQRYHHLLVDGFSFEALTQRVAAIYAALCAGATPAPSPFTPFTTVIEEIQQWQDSPAFARSASHWQSYAADLPETLTLSSENLSDHGDRPISCQVTLPQLATLREQQQLADSSEGDIVSALLVAYLARFSNSQRLSIGFPFMRRMGSAAISTLGPVVNVLPLIFSVSDEMTLPMLVQQVQGEIRKARRHQRYEAEQLRRDLGLVGSSQALYGPVINVKVYHDDLQFDGQPAPTHTLAMGPVDDLEFEVGFRDGALQLTLVANPRRYDAQTLQRHADRISHLLTQFAADADMSLGALSLLAPQEQIDLQRWSTGPTIVPPADTRTIVDILLQSAEQYGEQTAVVCGERSLSYRQLADRAMQLAHLLIARGLQADDVVAIGIPRSVDSLVAMFGVLASGAAYMPLDLDYPRERLALMCDDAQPKLLLTHSSTLAQMPELPHLLIDQLELSDYSTARPDTKLCGDDLAYMIYTSGSTGRPKGVMSNHQGLLNLFLSHREHLFGPAIARFTASSPRRMRAGHTASFSFDSSWEPLFCMLMGCELNIFDEELRRDAWGLIQQMNAVPVDLLDITPSFFSQMIDSGLLEADNHRPSFVMIGGEAATPTLWKLMQQQQQMEIHNYYGPSEYTIDTLGASVMASPQPVIGRPVGNSEVYLLDNQLRQVPIGCAGELYIAGTGIARGYLRRPDLTSGRFVANPFRDGDVMYRSGDLMRWRQDGQLAFIGRTDHQIKVRGFRVELGEVENALVALPEVSTAVVIAEVMGATHRLIGYCSVQDDALRAEADLNARLLAQLATQLPDYMVPAVLMVMDELPLNVNGKIDRQALPKPQQAQQSQSRAASTPQEQLICHAIASLLGLESVGAEDDFFALGGDSISAMGLSTVARRAGYLLRPREIFAERTAARMARGLQPLAQYNTGARVAQQGAIGGLPILHWFNAQAGIIARFAHGVLLSVPPQLQLTQLEQLIDQLAQAHPALNAFTRGDQLIVGEALASRPARVRVLEVQDRDRAAEQAFSEDAEALDPANGALLHATLLQQDGISCGLVLTLHHLIVDGVSWRVLLDELQQAGDALINNTPLVIPAEETSLHDWSAALLANLSARASELPFWQQMLAEPLPLVGDRAIQPRDRQQYQRTLLDASTTHALLNTLPQYYRATSEELLLTLLTMALRQLNGSAQQRVTLESHGRAELHAQQDLARTVGWLTAEFPLLLPLPDNPHAPLNECVRAVKAVLRAVPDRGIGYGQLRWLDAHRGVTLEKLAAQHAPQVLFNYLGRFTQRSGDWSPQRTAQQFRDTFAVLQDDALPLQHALELNVFVEEQPNAAQLALNWSWADGVLNADAIAELHQAMAAAAQALITLSHQQPQQAANTLVAAEVALDGVDDALLQQLHACHGAFSHALPLLPLQKGLLFHAQTTAQQGSYNSLTRLTLSGDISPAVVQTALDAVLQRHPQLAARFDAELSLQPLQLIPETELRWPLTLHQLADDDDIVALEHQMLAQDLFSQPIMLHATLIAHRDGMRWTLLLNAHHLVVDGWSTPVILNDLLSALRQQTLPAHSSSYADIVRQLSQRDSHEARQQWQECLQEVRPTLLYPQAADSAVNEKRITLDATLERELYALCRARGLTLNTVMQGLWGLMLSVASGQQDVVFGAPVSGRFGQINGIDQHVGLFSNTLPVRMRFDHQRPLLAQLADHQAQQIQLIEQDCLGLAEIQQLVGAGTLFDTLLVLENYPDNQTLLDANAAVRCEAIHNRGYTHYPLTLLVLPGEQLTLLMEYRDCVSEPERLAERLLLLLQQLVSTPDLPLTQWKLQTLAEQSLLAWVNNTGVQLENETLQQAIAQQAARTPDALALMDMEHRLSYGEMQRQAMLLADRLIEAGVMPGDIVAVALPRSVRLSIALTAILQAGAAYLPLDIGYPDERLAYMVEDARPWVLITESALETRFATFGTLMMFDGLATEQIQPRHPLPQADASRPAYVLYTSGSTGKPKGVVVNQRAIVNRLRWMQASYPLRADDVVLQKTPCSFDVSVWEFFWPLMTGAQLMMAPPEAHRDPQALWQLIDDYRVTTLHFVPSMLAAFVGHLTAQTERACPTLRRVFCSGEALACDLARSYQEVIAAPLHNLYGPTEAAVDVTWQPASGSALDGLNGPGVPIGRPVWNTQLHILDSLLRPVPVGVPGDLYLSGVQLADGYLHRADLTSQRFVAAPFAEGERMYRTGDIASWRADGAVEYLGRSDDQLKMRGQRIEPGEIEQALVALPGVAQAVVAARALTQHSTPGVDNRQLLGWLVAEAGVALDIDAVKQQLGERLPAHMQPVSYLLLDNLPLSANGKLDRKALPMPQLSARSGRLPHSANERLLADLFQQLLGCDSVFADDDFFALGGHSLLAMRLAAELRRREVPPLSVGQIIAARSVERLAALLDGGANSESGGNGELLLLRAGHGPTLFCIHPASGFAWQYSALLHYLDGDFPIVGLQSPRPHGVIAACHSVEAMCDHHLQAIRQQQPSGPYFLLGYSLGGTLAQGIAARLQAQGETVAFLGLLDTYPAEGQDWRTPDADEAEQEVAREQAEFMAATEDERDPLLREEKAAMFSTIVANYKDAVARLAEARTPRYAGNATLFMAEKTLPPDMDVRASWAPFVDELTIFPLDCEHADILSADSLKVLGPLINRLLAG
ncbi:amino acid adenylation domain-containing protein [Pantoea sp. YR343]|uniref:amino acid adenylation domain-containing protein n=1 Tax=Pantoea sp. YR343 TaxID=1144341 RepID=UPI0002710E7E|nr:non-ribosomal peptide synthetase [Pantoea sp. YR343]KAJ9430614.1 amino acid adenylation domain-containing protein [Pantoea sp. YR343]